MKTSELTILKFSEVQTQISWVWRNRILATPFPARLHFRERHGRILGWGDLSEIFWGSCEAYKVTMTCSREWQEVDGMTSGTCHYFDPLHGMPSGDCYIPNGR